MTISANTPRSALLAGEFFFEGNEALALERLVDQCEHRMRELLCLQHDATRPLQQLMAHHLNSGGARVRARLALSAAMRMQLPSDTALALAACCELIHNASLLHDDIQDGDSERRHTTAAWKQFTPELAMCGGVLMLSAAYQALTPLSALTASLVTHVHQRTVDLIQGQALDLDRGPAALSVSSYSSMAAGKSGSLLALPLELVMLAANQPASVAKARAAGEAFAIAYQIADDFTDFRADQTQDAMNIVRVLIRNGHSEAAAVQQARALITEHTQTASVLAAQLPNGSGGLLIELASHLRGAHLGSGQHAS